MSRMRKQITEIRNFIHRALTQPRDELSRAQGSVRYAIDLSRYAMRCLSRDRAPQMAAALTYRTIFSIVPVMVLALLVFRAFYSADQAEFFLRQQAYEYLNLDALAQVGMDNASDDEILVEDKGDESIPKDGDSVEPPDDDTTTDEASSTGESSGEEHVAQAVAAKQEVQKVRDSIDEMVDGFISNAYNISFGSVGGFGLILLIWAALALVVTVEQCFNRIYQAPTGRPWHARIMLYWAVLTLGPVLLVLGVYAAQSLTGRAEYMPGVGSLVTFLGKFAGFGSTWLMFTLLYKLMPNATVRWQPAVIGALTAAILWELAQWGFGLYVKNAVGVQKMYGNIALVPLSLFWLYMTWYIILFGIEISYTLQTVRRYQLQQQQQERAAHILGDPLWVIPIMSQIAAVFENGKTIERQTIADSLALPVETINRFCEKLEVADLINRVAPTKSGEDTGFALAKPPNHILLRDLIDLGRRAASISMNGHAPQAREVLDSIIAAERTVAADQTLADLVK